MSEGPVESAACPMCGIACAVPPGDTLVQCRVCRNGLKVTRAGAAVSLVLAEFEPPSRNVETVGRASMLPMLVPALLLAAMAGWHLARPVQPPPDVPPVRDGTHVVASRPGPPPIPPGDPGAGVPSPEVARGVVGPDPELLATAPAFQGVLPAGRQMLALFRIPKPDGSDSSWTGSIGQKVPGREWVLRTISMRPTSAVIQVPGGALITLNPGQTYVSGATAVTAPVPERPEPVIQRPRVVQRGRRAYPAQSGGWGAAPAPGGWPGYPRPGAGGPPPAGGMPGGPGASMGGGMAMGGGMPPGGGPPPEGGGMPPEGGGMPPGGGPPMGAGGPPPAQAGGNAAGGQGMPPMGGGPPPAGGPGGGGPPPGGGARPPPRPR